MGYARGSTVVDLSLDEQVEILTAAGCEVIFKEHVKTGDAQEEFIKCMKYLNSSDILIVSRLDRLGHTTKQLFKVVEELKQRHINLKILDLHIDTSSSEGINFYLILESLKEMEFQLLRERTRVSRESAKMRGRTGGRNPIDQKVIEKAKQMYAANIAVAEITKELSISRTTLYKYLKETVNLKI